MLLPGACAAINCPWCGLQTTGGDACDMCRRPLRQVGYVHTAPFMVPQDRSIDWARILAPAGIIASLAFGFVLFMQLVGYGRKAAQPRTLPPVKSASQLPGLSEVTKPMQGYADLVKKADASTTPEDDSLKREKDQLLAAAQSKISQGGSIPGAYVTNTPTQDGPQTPQMASFSGTVVPAGEETVSGLGPANDDAYIESANLRKGPGFDGNIVIVNPTDRFIETFDLTLQIGERVFPLTLTGQAADPKARGISTQSAVEVHASAQILGPTFGSARVVLRILYANADAPTTVSYALPSYR